ncbi:DUF1669 domain-containing protein [Sporosarcina sp. BI001-red]|uniref:phospholipase D-like domain-containing protein n=1 Tax=Sporosarcina sp. BI001-red TaxID=2282866 RepID=UPI000E287BCE|nr:phospholipase D-like domain-containing protein [Sporosarcina sp. BI001-red]REB05496.1 DUF1669 domain-containing protein [Sporosarcina sp. BI001-red]
MSNLNILLIVVLIASILLNVVLFTKSCSNENSSQPLGDGEIDYAFSHLANDPKTLLLDTISAATKTIDIAIYNFEDPEIAQTLFEAIDRGVKVRVLTDSEKAQKKSRAKLLDRLTAKQIDVKIVTSKKMHLKMTLVDGRLVAMGSYNFTEDSATENMEQLIVITDKELAKKWTDVFNKVWGQSDTEEWSK